MDTEKITLVMGDGSIRQEQFESFEDLFRAAYRNGVRAILREDDPSIEFLRDQLSREQNTR